MNVAQLGELVHNGLSDGMKHYGDSNARVGHLRERTLAMLRVMGGTTAALRVSFVGDGERATVREAAGFLDPRFDEAAIVARKAAIHAVLWPSERGVDGDDVRWPEAFGADPVDPALRAERVRARVTSAPIAWPLYAHRWQIFGDGAQSPVLSLHHALHTIVDGDELRDSLLNELSLALDGEPERRCFMRGWRDLVR